MKKLCALLRMKFFSQQDDTKIVKFDECVFDSMAVFLRQCHYFFKIFPSISKVTIYVPNIFHCLASPVKCLILLCKAKPAWVTRSIHYITLQHYNPRELLQEIPPFLKRDFWYKKEQILKMTLPQKMALETNRLIKIFNLGVILQEFDLVPDFFEISEVIVSVAFFWTTLYIRVIHGASVWIAFGSAAPSPPRTRMSSVQKQDYSMKVDVTSLKLEIRLHAHLVGTNTRSGTEASFALIWLAHHRSELRYFARSLISGLSDGARAATLKFSRNFILMHWPYQFIYEEPIMPRIRTMYFHNPLHIDPLPWSDGRRKLFFNIFFIEGQ